MNYDRKSMLFKALGDPIRLEIVDMISCGELCACKILERFNVTQPSLSHHMKILCGCGLVNGRKDGKWTYYSLNEKTVRDVKDILTKITDCGENCVCIETPCCEGMDVNA